MRTCLNLYDNSAISFERAFESVINYNVEAYHFSLSKDELVSDERFDIIDGPWQGEYSGYFSIADSRLGCGRGTADPSGKMIIPPHYGTMPIPVGNGMFTTLLDNEPVMIDCFGKALITPKS